jgi:ABC-type phosphate transport system permease subunit
MKRRWINFTSVFFTAATGLACLALTAMVALILGNIVAPWHRPYFLGLSLPSAPKRHDGRRHFSRHFRHRRACLLMTLAAVPLGVSTAIYLQEYAPKGSRWIHVVRLAIQNLAGVPRSFSACLGWDFSSSSWAAGWTRFFSAGLFISANRPFCGRRSPWRC